ncbi:DUF4097 family beta strand repeat-containing protein [Actinoplanes sp. G11-F43]|uniref:DUF4097 family beta strand repeat-containing protein n=1 Tax=Actinoplanes sp. G11-F43 TaxID=3424130 RepID=UPI003D3317C8
MPVFDTPASIDVIIELAIGDVRVTASDRADTVVDVQPSDPGDQSDVEAARQIRVDFADGVLRVIAPKRTFDFSRKSRSVEVTVGLPENSRISTEIASGDFAGAGRIGEARVKTSAGHIRIERSGPLRVNTSAGHVTVGSVTGHAEITTGSGKVQIGEVDGTAVIRNSNGETILDQASGDVQVRSANGDIRVDRAGAGVDARTSSGDIRLGEVIRGRITLGTSMGDLEVGVAAGTAAWLEVDTSFGKVRTDLADAPGPGEADDTVEVRGRTSHGDIRIHRSR